MACDHVFCLTCIRDWRSQTSTGHHSTTTTTTTTSPTTRTCPLCRQTSHFITPSRVWPRTAHEKVEIVKDYKDRLGRTECRLFARGKQECPFGTSCFYRHTLPDGTLAPREVRIYNETIIKVEYHTIIHHVTNDSPRPRLHHLICTSIHTESDHVIHVLLLLRHIYVSTHAGAHRGVGRRRYGGTF
jgi:hypothetical protein